MVLLPSVKQSLLTTQSKSRAKPAEKQKAEHVEKKEEAQKADDSQASAFYVTENEKIRRKMRQARFGEGNEFVVEKTEKRCFNV